MVTIGRTGIITTRWSPGHPIHVARPAEDARGYTALCGVKLRISYWIERRKGAVIDEDELCPGCKANGAVAEISGGRLRARPRIPSLRGRQQRDT